MKVIVVVIALAVLLGIFLKDRLTEVDIGPQLPPVKELQALAREMNQGLPAHVGDAEWIDTEARDGIIVKHYEMQVPTPRDPSEEHDMKRRIARKIVEEHRNPASGVTGHLLNGVILRAEYADSAGKSFESFDVTMQDCMRARRKR